MKTTSASGTALATSKVKLSLPARTFSDKSLSRPGSKIGVLPLSSASILVGSLSTQVTLYPKSDKHAPDTSPTYPLPMITIRVDYL